jgi:hypothetical protein
VLPGGMNPLTRSPVPSARVLGLRIPFRKTGHPADNSLALMFTELRTNGGLQLQNVGNIVKAAQRH